MTESLSPSTHVPDTVLPSVFSGETSLCGPQPRLPDVPASFLLLSPAKALRELPYPTGLQPWSPFLFSMPQGPILMLWSPRGSHTPSRMSSESPQAEPLILRFLRSMKKGGLGQEGRRGAERKSPGNWQEPQSCSESHTLIREEISSQWQWVTQTEEGAYRYWTGSISYCLLMPSPCYRD